MSFPDKHFATASGVAINPVDPQLDRINIKDIATALSNNCRWGGHVPEFLSVAQHSCTVKYLAELFGFWELDLRRQCLLHDASEAYLLDIPAPLKQQMPEYKQIEDRLQKAIAMRFGLHYPWHDMVHLLDKVAMVGIEAVIADKKREWFSDFIESEYYGPLLEKLKRLCPASFYMFPWSPTAAKKQFLLEAGQLGLV